jgi:hypothetical protein
LILLAFVLPLAVYCLILYALNRRHHPVVLSGTWDFAGVLLAASGFLLLGGPAILTGFYEQWRLSWLLGRTYYLQGLGENWSFWISLWLLYFAVVAGGSAWLLWRRRRITSIYNIEPRVFLDVLPQVLDRLGLDWVDQGPRQFRVRFRGPLLEGGKESNDSIPFQELSKLASRPPMAKASLAPLEKTAATAAPPSDSPWTELGWESSPAMRHVSLRWRGSAEALRREVETQLAEALAERRSSPSAMSAWFLSLGLGFFFFALLLLCALFVLRILQLLR